MADVYLTVSTNRGSTLSCSVTCMLCCCGVGWVILCVMIGIDGWI